MGRTYVQYIFVSMWRLDGRMRCGYHYLHVTDCYADYSRVLSFFVSDSWDFPDPSYFILIYENIILDSYVKLLTYSNGWRVLA